MRLKSSLCATIAVALAWPAAPALAQGERPSPTLSRFYFRLADGPRALSRMVGCLVNQNTEGARRLFDLDYGTPPQIQATSEFNKHGGNCLFGTNGLRSTNLMFMGAVAVELIAKDKPPRPTRVEGPMASNFQMGGGTHFWTWRNLTDQGIGRAISMSYCLLERHPDQVEAVLGARPNSNGERELFNGLNDEIDGCVPASEKWTLQPQILRAALAVAYYRSARAEVRVSAERVAPMGEAEG